ncbi:MAG: prephenate dehydratase [Candidatus Omnitrophica bacterium]|nr:prephenate dehydratase [Candidatus Omnitrophota bacterium]
MNLASLRRQIDRLDAQIVRLLNERTALALKIGLVKRRQGQGLFAPDRETQVFARLARLNQGPLPREALGAIYREVLSSALSLQQPMTVAYLGPADTFTHLAALKRFGSQVDYEPCDSITEVFEDVESRRVAYGVVPVENSIEGAVNHTLDMFIDSNVQICSEVSLEIAHTLAAVGPLARVRQVYSNPQVFGQCRGWLERHLPSADLLEVSSTAKAASLAAQRPGAAAIATVLAAKRYGLKVLANNIQDQAHNTTRFLVIGRQAVPPTGRDKTSVMFAVKDRVGALHDMLVPFREHRINLTKIESRPSKRKSWEYYFFVDLLGHSSEPKVQRALTRLSRSCVELKMLGSYPAETSHDPSTRAARSAALAQGHSERAKRVEL